MKYYRHTILLLGITAKPLVAAGLFPLILLFLKISPPLCRYWRISELEEIDSDGNRRSEADSFPDSIGQLTSKAHPQTSRSVLGLAVCAFLEPSEPSIEICYKIQQTINLQKSHYLIAHRGSQALPGRWSNGKWDEWRTTSPVFIKLMEWADGLSDKQELWLCVEDRSAK